MAHRQAGDLAKRCRPRFVQAGPGTCSKAKNKTPIFINVGRVSVEKNLEAFLDLPLQGEKWVVGDGPALDGFKKRYPEVRFWGSKQMSELPAIYNQADIFVFPSRTDTFGLVLLEAMACGLPVAAYPVTGPIDVIGSSDAGALDEDLGKACAKALKLRGEDARAHETFPGRLPLTSLPAI